MKDIALPIPNSYNCDVLKVQENAGDLFFWNPFGCQGGTGWFNVKMQNTKRGMVLTTSGIRFVIEALGNNL